MKQEQLEQFINQNEKEDVKDIFNLYYEKVKYLNKRSRQITLFALLLSITFALSLNAKIEKIDLGGFEIKDFSLFQKLTPLIFAYLVLEWQITSKHCSKVDFTLAYLTCNIYKIPDLNKNNRDERRASDLVNEILPFRMVIQLWRFRKMNLFNGIIMLVTFLIGSITPVIFLVYSIIHTMDIKPNFLTIPVILISAYILIYVYVDYIRYVISIITDNRTSSIVDDEPEQEQ